MLSPRGIHHADELRAMLDDGALPEDGPVELAHATVPTLDLAVRLTLADAGHLGYVDAGQPGIPERWYVVEADLELLWWLAFARSTDTAQ